MTSGATDVVERCQGCLLGQLAGDSLGGLVEFGTPDEILRLYPNNQDGLRGQNCLAELELPEIDVL